MTKSFHGFKKVASDHKSTTFAHPNGSRLIVAHAQLDPNTLDKISKLPAAPMADVQTFSGESGDPTDSEVDDVDNSAQYRKSFGEGVDKAESAVAPYVKPLAVSGLGKGLYDTFVGYPQDKPEEPQAAAIDSAPAPGQAPAPAPVPDQSQGLAPDPQKMPTGMDADPMEQWQRNVGAGVGSEMAGARELGNAQQMGSDLAAKQYEDQAKQIQAQQQIYQQHYNDLEAERQAFQQDVQNGEIDPRHFQESMTGAQKASTAIGLIMGGIGQGLIGGSNPAADFLNRQIDRDIDAQKQNLGKKRTLLEANLRQFGNLDQATQMTRVMMNDYNANKINSAAMTAAGPEAQARAKMAIGQIQSQNAMILGNLAASRAQQQIQSMGGRVQPQNMDSQVQKQISMFRMMGQKDRADDLQSRYVPNIGLSSIPVPQEARSQIISLKNVNDLMNKSMEFSQLHRGTLNPANIAQAKTIQNQLLGAIKQAQHDGVWKTGENDFLMSQAGGSPASFTANWSSVPHIRALQQIKQLEYNNLLQTHGLHAQPLPQTHPNEGMTASNAKGQKIIMRGGRWVPVGQ